MRKQRRQYIINRRYQGRFIGLYMAACVTGIVATTATMMYYIQAGLESRLYRTHLDISSTGDIILPVALQVNVAFLLLSVFVVGYISMHYSKKADRIAGVMVAGMRKLRDGRLDFQVEVGHEDEFPDLERLLNGMLDANRARLAGVVKAVDKAEAAARDLADIDKADPEARERALRRMKLKANALRKAMKEFTLVQPA